MMVDNTELAQGLEHSAVLHEEDKFPVNYEEIADRLKKISLGRWTFEITHIDEKTTRLSVDLVNVFNSSDAISMMLKLRSDMKKKTITNIEVIGAVKITAELKLIEEELPLNTLS